jgi:hypothetical protein
MSTDGPKQKKIKLAGWQVAAGNIAIKMGLVPLTQFIAIIATNQKKRIANLETPLSFLRMGKKLVEKEGIGVLVKASGTSAMREGVKAAGKVYYQKTSENFAKKILDHFFPGWSGTSRDIVQGIATGIPAGFADAVTAAPIERAKIYIMTSGKKMGFWTVVGEIYGQHQHIPGFGRITGFMNEMVFKGIAPSIIKQSAILSTIAITRPWANEAVAPYKKDHPIVATFIVAPLITGFCATVVSAIPDLYKIKKQSKLSVDSESFITFSKKAYTKFGIKALSGMPATLMLSLLGQAVNTGALNVYDEYVGVKDDDDDCSSPPPAAVQNVSNQLPPKHFEGDKPNHAPMDLVDSLLWGFQKLRLSEGTDPFSEFMVLDEPKLESPCLELSRLTLRE